MVPFNNNPRRDLGKFGIFEMVHKNRGARLDLSQRIAPGLVDGCAVGKISCGTIEARSDQISRKTRPGDVSSRGRGVTAPALVVSGLCRE